MTDALGPVALRLSGLAARVLGWRPGEFWAATPAELAAALSPILGLNDPSSGVPLDREALERMMETDNGR